MAGTIQFDGEFQSRTIEIQDVRIDWMLSPEFVTGEIPISQMTPENTLAICCILAEITGATHGGITRRIGILREMNRRPSPQSSPPRGEEDWLMIREL